jgi:hypothetical protein
MPLSEYEQPIALAARVMDLLFEESHSQVRHEAAIKIVKALLPYRHANLKAEETDRRIAAQNARIAASTPDR